MSLLFLCFYILGPIAFSHLFPPSPSALLLSLLYPLLYPLFSKSPFSTGSFEPFLSLVYLSNFIPKLIKCWYILWASKRLELVCVVNNLYNAIWPRSYEVIIKHPISSILNILNKPSLHFRPVSKKKRKKKLCNLSLKNLAYLYT